MGRVHLERHRTERSGWLRAGVLGANDGIVSTASLLIGVASAGAAHADLILAGAAGLAAGAMSMAAGEFVSVSSQRDVENSELERERAELSAKPEFEHAELAAIYEARGLAPALAKEVAQQLMARDALGAHAHDELGLSAATAARPLQAAVTSALAFAVGAALPLATSWWSSGALVVPAVALTSLLFLLGLGGLAAQVGGAPVLRAAARVGFFGALAMAVTAAVGAVFGALA